MADILLMLVLGVVVVVIWLFMLSGILGYFRSWVVDLTLVLSVILSIVVAVVVTIVVMVGWLEMISGW